MMMVDVIKTTIQWWQSPEWWLVILTFLTLGVMAIIAWAAFAVPKRQAQEQAKQARNERQLNVFKTLMKHRATLLPEHVEALNSIVLEFQDQPEVLRSWEVYFNHPRRGNEQWDDKRKLVDTDVWRFTQQQLSTRLLSTIGRVLGYDLSEVDVETGWYSPQQKANDADAERKFRDQLLDATAGGVIKMGIVNAEKVELHVDEQVKNTSETTQASAETDKTS